MAATVMVAVRGVVAVMVAVMAVATATATAVTARSPMRWSPLRGLPQGNGSNKNRRVVTAGSVAAATAATV